MDLTPSPPHRGCPIAAPARRIAAALVLLAVLTCPLSAQRPASARPHLTELSLEELMEVEVTTVSKNREKLTNAPAAVFSLNAEDLQRAAVKTLPDALRLVPGMQVGRVDAHDWAISARGFADVFSNKLLVLQDGRSLYTPLFSGVFWDAQDTMLEDIERIEVIRGPGATLWGANAVNGVINILTKPASETQGGLAAITAGTDPRFSARARYGGAFDPATHFRVYAKHTQHDNSPALGGGGRASDAWRLAQTGFRIDRRQGAENLLTLQGDAYRGSENQIFILPDALPPFTRSTRSRNTFDGANLLGRWTRRSLAGRETTVQSYFDYTGRETSIFGETRRTFDLEAQQRFAARAQQITVGAGYRTTADRVENTPAVSLEPPRRRTDLWNAFVQDDIELSKSVHLILGSKFEHNDFTGWEVQPGARLLWTPDTRNTLWASAARAVRTPSRAEHDVRLRQITTTPGVSVISSGSRDFNSEILAAFEAGWRFRARDKFSIDLATFVNRYRGLRTNELSPASLFLLSRLATPTPPAPPIVLMAAQGNNLRGETYGGEIAAAAQLAAGWRLRASYSHLEIALRKAPHSTDLNAELAEGRSPKHQGYLWSQHDLSPHWRFDFIVRAVSRLPAPRIPAYAVADARLAWRPSDRTELSIAGRNLFDRRHPEFLPTTIFSPPTETARSAHLEIKYEF